MNKNIILLLILALFATSSAAVLARMVPELNPVVIAFWRVLIAAGFLWAYSGIRSQGSIKNGYRGTIVLTGVLLGLHFACFFQAVKLTTVANATLFSTIPPLFTALVERFYLKRQWNKKIIFGLLCAFAGLTLVFSNQINVNTNHVIGIGFAIIGSVLISAVWLLSEKIRQNTESIVYIRTLFLSAALPLFLGSLFFGDGVANIKPVDIVWLTALGLFPTVIGHGLYNHALKFMRPTIVASFPLGEPIIASGLAYAVFGEPIGLLWAVGGLITLFGLIIITLNH
ncbi:MAG: DMT family transporter [Candidatus Marinimicrobia bacterium]|jgi:drug/metabolite transporter (DMT)-like permease|nr:DMT family transporter [Candidatus Neomarinimicrobiota bacterium]MBT3617318.1 DMT family transporter [Candidatus Neomarinimicrobiota bacterium]MBT3828566.1 DMT family transporter [Candidatus Neomarinimicrobiota bacterium]MBT3997691.1 DMT family transporter [Candidatus Neomarinimicrobiota bacterium]MBT4281517.1 DMT family transporter [Candidatus Neomarinimicrobiota bacterium]